MAQSIDLEAVMEDGRTLKIAADQRDFAKWEIQPEATGQTAITRMRFLAWSSAFRQQLYKGSFVEFNELDCIEVGTPDNGESEEAGGLDPGRSAASADA